MQLAFQIKNDGPAASTIVTAAATHMLNGMGVLLAEDQTLIALDTEMMLRELGAAAVNSFTSSQTALTWLASASPDVAVLDINLGATSSFAIAEELGRRSIPFVFITGYGSGDPVPERFSSAPIVHKPYTLDALTRALAICLAARAG